MFKLENETAFRNAFRPKDRELIEMPVGLRFPLFIRDYLAWTHPAGGHVFLVFAVPQGAPTGIVFETNGATPGGPQMCDFCHSSATFGRVTLLTTYANAVKRVGAHVCADLSCKQKLEEEADRTGRSVLPAMQKLMTRIGRFASEGLGIDLTGVAR